jgi:iron complex outermembrane receptor protein
MTRTRLLTGIAAILSPSQLLAQPSQEQPSQEQPASRPRDHVHEQEAPEIVVTAPFVRELDLLAGTSTLTGNALARDLQPQLGDTLARLPGVSATSFSPGASRPVLRGFQGERVRVLVDGIGSIDVSNTSADHAVTIDPITADRIEVLHGPAVLLFGGQAIGGAVNVFDRRIPRRVPDDKLFHVDALAAYGSAANERSIGAGLDVALGGGLVLHLDGSYRNTDDLDTGGFILSPNLRAEQLEIAAEEEAEGHLEEAAEARELAGLRGVLPNSATEQTTGGVGLALIRDWGSIGGSISIYESRYGIPSRPGGGHHHAEEGEAEEGEEHGDVPVSIDLEQFRGDFRGDIALGGGMFDRLRLRFAAADYQHVEFEGDEVGTLFETNGLEGASSSSRPTAAAGAASSAGNSSAAISTRRAPKRSCAPTPRISSGSSRSRKSISAAAVSSKARCDTSAATSIRSSSASSAASTLSRPRSAAPTNCRRGCASV